MKYFGFIVLFLFSFSCKTQQLPPDQYKDAQISFGSGGGFSGEYHEYTLLDDGRLFQKNRDGQSYTFLKKLNTSTTTQLFQNIKTFGIDSYKYNEPQNLYYFLSYSTPNTTNKIVWSGQPENKLSTINSMYKLLVTYTKISTK